MCQCGRSVSLDQSFAGLGTEQVSADWYNSIPIITAATETTKMETAFQSVQPSWENPDTVAFRSL
jgi:hypothetical protein